MNWCIMGNISESSNNALNLQECLTPRPASPYYAPRHWTAIVTLNLLIVLIITKQSCPTIPPSPYQSDNFTLCSSTTVRSNWREIKQFVKQMEANHITHLSKFICSIALGDNTFLILSCCSFTPIFILSSFVITFMSSSATSKGASVPGSS